MLCFTRHSISVSTKRMSDWACSKGRRCKSRTVLSADNFRKGPTGPPANQYFHTCNICRERPLCPLNGETPSTVRCASCYLNRDLQDFVDDNGVALFQSEISAWIGV